jgi:hypothetical protein
MVEEASHLVAPMKAKRKTRKGYCLKIPLRACFKDLFLPLDRLSTEP